jgi:hypothetical protein
MINFTVLMVAGALLTPPAKASGPAARPTVSPDPEDRMVCQKMLLTGSLVNRLKICRTQREWKQISRDGRAFLSDVVRRGDMINSIPGG